jgi:hypothetical protein
MYDTVVVTEGEPLFTRKTALARGRADSVLDCPTNCRR